ncbi:DUF1127 domain-containing protein [Aquicoccus sp. SCR17]|nr:DUF1127 domain-containing protein [Carideicomes alvinocaridis]
MAYATQDITRFHGFSGWLADMAVQFAERAERRRVFRRTVRELNSLSNRELADLGIHRSMITRLALEASNEHRV